MMAHFTPSDYDRIERAIADGRRIVVSRRGREVVVIPRQLRLRGGREEIEAQHPTTGDRVVIALDDMDAFEVVTW
jgi:hypothetical protein